MTYPAASSGLAAAALCVFLAGVAWASKRQEDKHHVIDQKVEQPTRTMPGHAIRHEFDELANAIRAVVRVRNVSTRGDNSD